VIRWNYKREIVKNNKEMMIILNNHFVHKVWL